MTDDADDLLLTMISKFPQTASNDKAVTPLYKNGECEDYGGEEIILSLDHNTGIKNNSGNIKKR